MSTERTFSVAIPAGDHAKLALLRKKAEFAAERLRGSDKPDRDDAMRYQQLVAEIESLAYEALAGASSQGSGSEDETIAWPFEAGPAPFTAGASPNSQPAKTWHSTNPHASRTDATYERFKQQLEAWTTSNQRADKPPALCPSDIQNRALTEALRTFASGCTPIEATVCYRDGSAARAFPLQSVRLSDVEPNDGREILRMTLLSIRHVEMDVEVDGAWLRNRHISLPRPAGQTDEIAYQQSLEQFASISADGPITLHLFQTGLAPANVGFYRALIDHHRRSGVHPIAVVPHYFTGGNTFARSKLPWVFER